MGPLPYRDLGRRRLGPPAPPEALAPLAAWLAAAADRWWEAGGRPDPFTVVVVSGDDGRLAAAVVAAAPACSRALRYVLVDPDHAEPPARLSRNLALEDPAFLYPTASRARSGPDDDGEDGEDDGDDQDRPAAQGIGPLFTFLGDVPGLGDDGGAIVAIGWLSLLAYDVFVLGEDGHWSEQRLAWPEGTDPAGTPLLVARDRPPSGLGPVDRLLPGRHVVWRGALDWFRRALVSNPAGVLAVVEPALPPVAAFAAIRPPVTAEPVPVPGTGLSALEWRIG